MSDLAGPNQHHDSTAIERLKLAGAIVAGGAGFIALQAILLSADAVHRVADLGIRASDFFRGNQIPQ